MWEMILAGRYMMIPITLASLVGLAVLIERIYVLRQGRIIVPEIAEARKTRDGSGWYEDWYESTHYHGLGGAGLLELTFVPEK